MQVKCCLFVLAIALTMASPKSSWAAGELHLMFHMGSAGGGAAFVGGTLLNSGDAPVAHGYLVLTLLDAQCRPLRSLLETFGPIPAGEKRGFRIAVGGDLRRYRLLGLQGFDSSGFAVPTVDDNEAILNAREAEERVYCAQAQRTLAE